MKDCGSAGAVLDADADAGAVVVGGVEAGGFEVVDGAEELICIAPRAVEEELATGVEELATWTEKEN
jgi:hypothetical protein